MAGVTTIQSVGGPEDFDLREQYLELAVRYLEMAEKFEDGMVAAAVLNGRSRGN